MHSNNLIEPGVMARLASYAELSDGAAIASCGEALAHAGVTCDLSVAVSMADELTHGVSVAQEQGSEVVIG